MNNNFNNQYGLNSLIFPNNNQQNTTNLVQPINGVYATPVITQLPTQQQNMNNFVLPDFNPPKDPNELFYKEFLLGILKHGLTSREETNLSATKGYICTLMGNNRPDGRFGLTINLGHNTEFRNLEPYVYNMNEASVGNGGYGDVIDDAFLATAAWLSPLLSAKRDNYSSGNMSANGDTVRSYMDSLSNYLDKLSNYISPLVALDQFGQVVRSPQLAKALMKRYRFGGINITPNIILTPKGPLLSFLYSLSEEITLELKRDISYMVTE